ncbi:ParB N-terminal domain-containing protein [Streptomyces sp. NBC_01237]|uniref:ParB N-terminal domain-containing protein n=1 Tax=Streptomyces sp. NBC_01237 TaxID=2903790 RepID=UPI002DD7E616|nr:ParB N-terminal domain-containing protein [Streptomyces sp. NBC_01237]WRZ78727.1 ParB N-terminal domain-containing protein [Streptomyces sp. NBC_01237]
MTRYQGTLPTALLRDDVIRPTEYTRWAHAHTRFARREKDAAILQNLLETIPHQGLRTPIVLGVSDRHGDVYVADGHHRAVALRVLRAPRFPFHWYWIKNVGVRIEDRPFPYYLLEERR